MAVICRLALTGILCLTLIYQVSCVCRSCPYKTPDEKCKDKYQPKNELTACVPSAETNKKMCSNYKGGWKAICKVGVSTFQCKTLCPQNSAANLNCDVITMVAVVFFSILHRLFH
ncbi:uncharacterized protein LOC124135685 [Haliotis rufescens]|uniref:uncharacterized protein LOC124135685 n=1 Tax=Haliotis rufescens TaxID=6454 RepID=UPI00201F50DA|nr:uncharacterized protein LOC124135685 [Haliotis rufescens]